MSYTCPYCGQLASCWGQQPSLSTTLGRVESETRWVKRAEREPTEAGEYPVVMFYPGTEIYGKSWADWSPGVLGGWRFRAHEIGARVILWAENMPSLIV